MGCFQLILTVHFYFNIFLFFFIDYSPCGVSPVDFRARMVGGKNSKRGWWPWQIGLYKYNDEGILKSFSFVENVQYNFLY